MKSAQWHWQEPGTAWRGCGIYHITLVQSDRTQPLLGRLTECADPAEATVERTQLGNAIVEEFLSIPHHRPEVKPLTFCLMPDHFHGIIYVTDQMQSGIMSLVRGFWQGCKKAGRAYSRAAAEAQCKSEDRLEGEAAIKSQRKDEEGKKGEAAIKSQRKDEDREKELWEYDPIFGEMPFVRPLAGQGQLEAMIRYVKDNPRRAAIRRQHPDLYHLKRDTHWRGLSFTTMGNRFLLDWPMKRWVEVSRSASQEQQEAIEKEQLQAASLGWLICTAAVSEGEKRIARAVREAGYPLLILMKDGFPAAGSEQERHYKPGGVYFDACGAGRLLLMEPSPAAMQLPEITAATHEALRAKAAARHADYEPLPATTERYRFMACNVIGRLLTAEPEQ